MGCTRRACPPHRRPSPMTAASRRTTRRGTAPASPTRSAAAHTYAHSIVSIWPRARKAGALTSMSRSRYPYIFSSSPYICPQYSRVSCGVPVRRLGSMGAQTHRVRERRRELLVALVLRQSVEVLLSAHWSIGAASNQAIWGARGVRQSSAVRGGSGSGGAHRGRGTAPRSSLRSILPCSSASASG